MNCLNYCQFDKQLKYLFKILNSKWCPIVVLYYEHVNVENRFKTCYLSILK